MSVQRAPVEAVFGGNGLDDERAAGRLGVLANDPRRTTLLCTPAPHAITPHVDTGNESVPIQLAQCWFPAFCCIDVKKRSNKNLKNVKKRKKRDKNFKKKRL